MKINPVSGLIKFAQTKPIQRYSEWASQPKIVKRIDNLMPTIESAYITGIYCIDVKKNKEIPKERKNPLLYNNIICFIGGAIGSHALNKVVKPFQENLINHLREKNIPKVSHIEAGIKTIVPLITFSLMIRYILPVIATPLSVSVNNFFKKKIHIKSVKNDD